MKTRLWLSAVLFALSTWTSTGSVAFTGPYTLSYDNLATGSGVQPFSLPMFNSSLGTLQRVDLAYEVSGTVVGSATGVSSSLLTTPSVTHWVFFDFTDITHNVFVAEPALSITASIPGSSTTILFGPQFQSRSQTWSVTQSDPRFRAWENGPGDFSGTLRVYFTNTGPGYNNTLQSFSGTDSGLYAVSLSISYEYIPVPEPSGLALAGLGAAALLVFRRRN